MGFNSSFTPAPDHKIKINLGCGFDIISGRFVTGARNESLLNGGLSATTGFIGPGNFFKSTQMHFQALTAMARVANSEGGSYDTEVSMEKERMANFSSNSIPDFKGEDVIGTGRWSITNSAIYSGNKWWEAEKTALQEKAKEKGIMIRTPYMNYNRTELFKTMRPTFREIDSLSEWRSDRVDKILNETEIGDKEANMMYMTGGNDKTRLIAELPNMTGKYSHYMLMSAHLGSRFNLDPRAPVRKQLQHIPQDFKIKGVPEKFLFHMNNAWLCFSAELLRQDKGDKTVEYPRSSNDDNKNETDLNLIWVVQTRGKSGPSGMPLGVIVSQEEGVLPTLSEFHMCKLNDRYGIVGSKSAADVQNYSMALHPDVKLSRTTVRRKIDSDPLLRNAILISSQMCQIDNHWHDDITKMLMCTPQELFDDLRKKGYDWETLLKMRNWVGIDADAEYDNHFLSTMDLLRMRLPHDHKLAYHPYWMAPRNADGSVTTNEIIEVKKLA
jgi:hypothetical protein